jgi:peptidyl-prolyl cis-trans isomerase A (cyclophilin A)
MRRFGVMLLLLTLPALSWAQKVALDTTLGTIVIQLNAQAAPKTVANFLEYVKSGHYDNTVFHRVMSNFMIQAGGYTADLNEKPTRAPIALESQNGLKNDRGAVSMARRGDPNSATSQFFVNLADNSQNLDNQNGGFTVFARVLSGNDMRVAEPDRGQRRVAEIDEIGCVGRGRLDEERLVGERCDQWEEVGIRQAEQEGDRERAEDEPDGDGRTEDDPAQDDDRRDDREQQTDEPRGCSRDRVTEQNRDRGAQDRHRDHRRRSTEGPSMGTSRMEHEQERAAAEDDTDELSPDARRRREHDDRQQDQHERDARNRPRRPRSRARPIPT